MAHRILFVTQQLPWPKDSGGNIRTYFMLEALARRFDVVLCSTSDGSDQALAGERRLQEMCSEVHLVPDEKRRSGRGEALGVLRALFSGQSAVLKHNQNAGLGTAVQRVLEKGGVDSVHLNHLDTTPYIDLKLAPPVVIDTHNLLFDYYARRGEMESGLLRRLVCRREAKLLRTYEPEIFSMSRRVVVCSETERSRLLELDPELPVEVVANGVDCSAFRPATHERFPRRRELVFVGDLGYGPNQDAALYFIREVLPLVQDAEPRARFLAVGKNPSDELLALGRGREDIVVTGYVEDVAEWVQRATLYVVPIRYGSGTRLKVLEAFAFGKPTLSTTVGAEGIEYREGHDILIRDEPKAMADAIVALFADPERAKQLGAQARRTAEASYDWPQIGDRMIAIHQELSGA